ncbi:MAG: GDP-mannose 4,6-dehydratase [Actinomycetota bacterium]|nr:GDP-mannose 4,6-dehydratase [Actinomycetota bacterium]MDQ2982539.1 GDP-mannose 4,6-dehydratase [Actinomycetota bacterium]
MRAIVTGGAGFVGSHVADQLLARGDEVHLVDDLSTGYRDNVPAGAELHEHDIRVPLGDLFGEIGPEVVFHLAAQADVRVSVDRPDFDAEVNVLGTIRVLEAARAHETQVVFSSTGGAIYGETDGPAPETAERRPMAPYGTSKLCAEEYLATFNRLYGTQHVALRYGNVYGPRQKSHLEGGVVAIFMRQLASGETPTIFGDGRQTRDFTYVADIARATLAAAGHDTGVFNIGTGQETSVLELYDACRRVAGSDVEPQHAPARLGELQRNVIDPALAAQELGWRPEHSLEDGLRLTWEAFSSAQEGAAAERT